MDQIHLFRKRYIPNEITELKNDSILSASPHLIVTRWDVLKPRTDISWGISAYYPEKGFKISKIFNTDNNLVYWYCDIIRTEYQAENNSYTFHDLLVDVLIYPDGHVEVVDLDEFADAMEQGILDSTTIAHAMRVTNDLLQIIYNGHFSDLTDCINHAEKTAVRS